MASLYCKTIRHLAFRQSIHIPRSQRRWARVHDVRFLTTHQTRDRIINRYKEKLDQKAKQEGHDDIDQLTEAYKDKIRDLRKKATIPGATESLRPTQQPSPQRKVSQWQQEPPRPPEPQPEAQSTSQQPHSQHKAPAGVKTLSSFLDIPKILELPPKEIEHVWRLRHSSNKQSLCAAMRADTFTTITKTARQHPQFILPGLPRKLSADNTSGDNSPSEGADEGAPIHFMQWNFTGPDTVSVLFTHLAEYKLRGEYSQPHTTLTHHLELAGPKGLVLCQGHVLPDRGVSVEEGKWLVMCMQKFYNTDSVGEDYQAKDMGDELQLRRRRLMEKFTEGDTSFRVEDLLEEAERMG